MIQPRVVARMNFKTPAKWLCALKKNESRRRKSHDAIPASTSAVSGRDPVHERERELRTRFGSFAFAWMANF